MCEVGRKQNLVLLFQSISLSTIESPQSFYIPLAFDKTVPDLSKVAKVP